MSSSSATAAGATTRAAAAAKRKALPSDAPRNKRAKTSSAGKASASKIIPGAPRLVPCWGCVKSALSGKISDICRSQAPRKGGDKDRRCCLCAAGHSCEPCPEIFQKVGARLVRSAVDLSNGESTPALVSRVKKLRTTLRTMMDIEEEEEEERDERSVAARRLRARALLGDLVAVLIPEEEAEEEEENEE